jgi:hypothetical protein
MFSTWQSFNLAMLPSKTFPSAVSNMLSWASFATKSACYTTTVTVRWLLCCKCQCVCTCNSLGMISSSQSGCLAFDLLLPSWTSPPFNTSQFKFVFVLFHILTWRRQVDSDVYNNKRVRLEWTRIEWWLRCKRPSAISGLPVGSIDLLSRHQPAEHPHQLGQARYHTAAVNELYCQFIYFKFVSFANVGGGDVHVFSFSSVWYSSFFLERFVY